MNKKTQQVVDSFQQQTPAKFKNGITEVRYKEKSSEALFIEIVRASGKVQAFKIPFSVLDTAVKHCLDERRLLAVSELHKLEGVGSWQESPVWAILNLMPDNFWKE